MASQIPIKVMKDGSDNTCGLAQFTSSDSVAIAAGGTGLNSQGICEFVQPGLYAVGCQVTYLGICAGKADTGVGYDNTYVGHSAGIAVTTACRHTIIGSQAGKAITTCSGTVAIGYNAGLAQTFGDFNTLIGTAGGAAITTASNNTVIGYHAATATICSNNIAVGTCAMVANTQGQDNIAIGVKAGATQVAAGCNNVFIGSNAGAVSLCRDNISIGSYAGKAATTGGGNVMIGACVGYGVVGGAYNVYVGDKAGLANTSGNDNVFIGKCAGCATTGSCCLIIGNATGTLIAGDFNSGVVEINSAYCLPAADGSASQFLCTDGSGALAFATLVSSPWSTSGCFITTPANCFVGIGETTPDNMLHVTGVYDNTNGTIKIQSSNNDASILAFWNKDTAPHTDSRRWALANNFSDYGHFEILSGTSSTGAPQTSRLAINSAGAVCIGPGLSGVTPWEHADNLVVEGTGNTGISILADGTANASSVAFGDAADNDIGKILYQHGTNSFEIYANTVLAMGICCDGEVVKPLTPAFLVQDTTQQSDVTGDSTHHTVVYETEVYDQGGDMGTCVFTAPVAGRYLFTWQSGPLGLTTAMTGSYLNLKTSNRTYTTNINQCAAIITGGYAALTQTVIADMDAADTACTVVVVVGGTKVVDIGGNADYFWWSGALIA